ncbi:MAG: hypothetical protein JW715_05825 [Sedimentisphaerales bacterium]|nr:hypothetical protein [Sedimentisphaerales bacterium]
MKNYTLYAILSMVLFASITEIVQCKEESNIEDLMKARIESARIRENPPEIKITDEQLKAADPNKLLDILAPYEEDTESFVRSVTHINIVKIANLHPDNTKVRQEVVRRLTEATYNRNDKPAGRLLMTFTAKDFSEPSKALIRQAMDNVNTGVVGGSLCVWLCGIADLQEEMPRLEKLMINEVAYNKDPNMRYAPKWYYTTGWAARLARARMGVKEDIEICVSLIEEEIDKNNNFQLLDKLGYIRRPEAIKSLKKYLDSDKRLPRINENTPGSPYADYVLDILIDSLENFPIEKKPGRGYRSEQIETARKWMSKQSKWIIRR